MVSIVVNLMRGVRLVKTGKRKAPGTELLLTPMSFPSENQMERLLYSERISYLRGEILHNRLVMLEGVRHDLKTGYKEVTIRGLSIGQVLKDKIDEMLAGDLEDRCIIQKTRMTRHIIRLLGYIHKYEQLNDIMFKKPIKFLRIMTRKHDSLKIQEKLHTKKEQGKLLTQKGKKKMVNIMVNLMKGMRLVSTGKRQARLPLSGKSLYLSFITCNYTTPD